MKTLLCFIVVLGATQAVSPSFGGISGMLRNPLSNLNISDFNLVRNLFNQSSVGGEMVLKAAAATFVTRFRKSAFLAGKSRTEIARNFMENARNILSQPIDPNWTPGLDIELLGMSQSEFQSLLTATPPPRSERQSSITSSNLSRSKRQSDLPKSVDWRTKNAVTPVKNQGQCGSCWAFAAVGALEGRLAVKTGKLTVLSEQNLVDCAKNITTPDKKECCQGCQGGWMTEGYNYVQQNGGIMSNTSYPYEAKDGQCRYNAATKAQGASTTGFKYIAEDDEEELMRAVAEGPVAVAVDATQWSAYKAGVFRCKTLLTLLRSTTINHGVVIVGYGSSFLGGDYWIVKNSWGNTWGENGYIRIARNAGNQCGIAGSANYPIVYKVWIGVFNLI